MQLFKISVQEFENRFGADLISKEKNEIWLIKNKMAAVISSRNKVNFFGEVELDGEEELELLTILTPEFTYDIKDETIPAKTKEDYLKESKALSTASSIAILIPMLLIALFCILCYIVVN